MIQQIAISIKTWLQHEYEIRDEKQRLRTLATLSFPIIVSFIIVQLQHNQNQQNQHHSEGTASSSASILHYLWHSTIMGIASLIVTLWHLLCRIIGTSLGIGLGLGLAGHVFELLDQWKETSDFDNEECYATASSANGNDNKSTTNTATTTNTNANHRRRSIVNRTSSITLPIHTNLPTATTVNDGQLLTNNTPTKTTSASSSKRETLGMEDANSYHSLMRCAGYIFDNGTLRCQMVRGEQAVVAMKANSKRQQQQYQHQHQQQQHDVAQQQQNARATLYKFDKGVSATIQMKRMWPNLAPVINESLAKLTEFVIRDYVASWYAKVDENVVVVDPATAAAGGGGGGDAMVAKQDVSTAPTTVAMASDADSMQSTPITSEETMKGARKRRTIGTPSEVNLSFLQSSLNSKNNASSSRSFMEGEDAPPQLAPASSASSAVAAASSSRPPSQFAKSMPVMSATSMSMNGSPYPQQMPSQKQQFQTPQPTQQQHQQHQQQQQQQQRTMVLTTAGTRPAPFIDSLYTSFAYLLGMLATRASENVNILELLLLHFPHVLAQNLRIYRELRGVAVEKKRRRIVAEREKLRKRQMAGMMQDQSGESGNLGGGNTSAAQSAASVSSSVTEKASQLHSSHCPAPSSKKSNSKHVEISEIAIVREYLLAGRLHRGVTFGLDVPSLLFADPFGKDCPPGPSYPGNNDVSRQNGHPDEDAILEHRLLSPESTLINECELDYNRVMAARISKLVVPKIEIDSSIVRTMLVEMLAACVLNPIMGTFSPDYVNGWILKGLGLLGDPGTEGAAEGTASDAAPASLNREDSVASTPVGNGDSLTRSVSVSSSFRDERHDEDEKTHVASVGSDDDELLDTVLDGAMSHMPDVVGCEGSVASELEESLFGIESEYNVKAKPSGMATCNKSEQIITLLSMSIIELRHFIDFEECRYARETNADIVVDWDNAKCREAVRHLVLVVEAALLLGGRSERKRSRERDNTHNELSEMEIEATLEQPRHEDGTSCSEDDFEVDIDVVSERHSVAHQHSSLSMALMELTGDIDAFERLVVDAEQQLPELEDDDSLDDGEEFEMFIPRPNELSTLRTLIAAWLHTGQAFKVLSIIARAKHTILKPFYHKTAFIRRENYSKDFTKLLRQLDDVDILVDTMAVLASKCLLMDNGFDNLINSFEREVARGGQFNVVGKTDDSSSISTLSSGISGQQRPYSNNPNMSVVGSVRDNIRQNRDRLQRFAQTATESFQWGHAKAPDQFDPYNSQAMRSQRPPSASIAYNVHQNSQNTPAYLDFNKNSVFASSLRSERDRRIESWAKETNDRERIEYICRSKGVKDKDALMHKELHHLSRYFFSNTNEVHIDPCSLGDSQSNTDSAANIIVKAVASRRKIEVPDEDSSFLLRGQPRPLKPAAIHRDQNAANLTCKIYVAMFEEPAIHPRTKRFYGGRYLRQCLLRYYPNDRTASVTVAKDVSVLDHRQGQSNENFGLPEAFQRQRHSCLKVAVGGILSSPLMEPSDFAATPRAGKALDFVYRVSLFEKPMVELGGKKFVVHDASSSHRADASSLELSDASMSAAIIVRGSCGLNICDDSSSDSSTFSIKVSSDGTPLVLLRSNSPDSPVTDYKAKDEARPYRPSFIRAAMFVKSARQEAQSQCLTQCIRGGSARSSSKIKSDELLQPTLALLRYANSRRQEEQSILLRDLRFGINHIDRGQLCRNGLLNPRFPTILRGLTTRVEGAVEVKASNIDLLGPPTLILFKIRCTAITEFIGEEEGNDNSSKNNDALSETKKSKRAKSRYFREEWTVLRSLKDFSVFHKHIKGQVSPAEHSASASARLVGAATAALTIVGGNNSASQRRRGPFVPSLSLATKAGTLGLSTKKVVEKRKKLLDEYLKYLVSPNNLLSRCPELLKFLGAYTNIFPLEGNEIVDNGFGRERIKRDELDTKKLEAGIVQVKHSTEQVTPATSSSQVEDNAAPSKTEVVDDVTVSTVATTNVAREESSIPTKTQSNATKRLAYLRAGEVRLKDVRRASFRLLRQLFDLDNASFFRSRVISALKTMTVAITSVQDFHLMLFQMHIKYMNGDWISGWIFYVVDMFWPNGVFYTKAPDLTEQEKLELKINSKTILEKSFPDQLKTVLGKHTEEGLDLLHEMLQNRLVLKSMAYMLLDMVWAEIFPELGDFVTGAECLDKEA